MSKVDVEAFSSQKFYKILMDQSIDVTSNLGVQKDEVKSLYQKVAQQTQSLKGERNWSCMIFCGDHNNMITKYDRTYYYYLQFLLHLP